MHSVKGTPKQTQIRLVKYNQSPERRSHLPRRARVSGPWAPLATSGRPQPAAQATDPRSAQATRALGGRTDGPDRSKQSSSSRNGLPQDTEREEARPRPTGREDRRARRALGRRPWRGRNSGTPSASVQTHEHGQPLLLVEVCFT